MADKMTSLDARAVCFGTILQKRPDTWAKAEADAAGDIADALLKSGKIDQDVYREVVRDVTGNHSQNRQSFQAMSFLPTKERDSALKRAILAVIEKLDKTEDSRKDELNKIGDKSK